MAIARGRPGTVATVVNLTVTWFGSQPVGAGAGVGRGVGRGVGAAVGGGVGAAAGSTVGAPVLGGVGSGVGAFEAVGALGAGDGRAVPDGSPEPRFGPAVQPTRTPASIVTSSPQPRFPRPTPRIYAESP